MDSTTAQPHAEEHHGLPASGYMIVLLILLAMTGLTYYTGKFVSLPGSWNLIVALIIAVTKASIVSLFFMHLWGDSRANQLVFILATLFLILMITMTVLDINTRFPLSAPPGSERSKVPVNGTLN
jgi:cytochrome c oxidase subunit 4